MKGYLKNDLQRIFCNWRFWLSVIGVAAIFWLGISMDDRRGVLTPAAALESGIYGLEGLLCLVCSSVPFSGSLCEDTENRFLGAECFRGDYKSFARVRTITIFGSAALTMLLGILCYGVGARAACGKWYDIQDSVFMELAEKGTWYIGMLKKAPLLFWIVMGLIYSLLAGLLALVSALLSLFWANKLLVMSIPFLTMYLLLDLSMFVDLWRGKLNVWYIFDPFNGVMESDVGSFLYAVAFAAAAGWLLYRAIRWKIERRLFHG